MNYYLDSSALVKYFSAESSTVAVRGLLESDTVTSTSALSRVEVVRAAQRIGAPAVAAARRALGLVLVLELDGQVLDRAGTMMPGSSLRILDAIHLASAEVLGPSLTAVVTYDRRMIEAAEQLGLRVITP